MNNARKHVSAVIASAAIVALAVLAVLQWDVVLRGWLAGFVWASLIPIGALTLLCLHRVTGGEWGDVLAPTLEPAAKAILPLAILALPILIFSPTIYRWSSPEISRTVSLYYMNGPLFALRSIVALSFWSAAAWSAAFRATSARAGLVLVAMAILTNVVPQDWVVATQPGFSSSAFGFGFASEAVLAALAVCAFVGRQGDDRRECRDLSGLIISAQLGTVYFSYMQFVVIWYGNLPDPSAWYVARRAFPWPEIGGGALALGALVPFLALLNQRIRQSEWALRIVGGSTLLGIALHAIWWIVPSFGIHALPPAVLSVALMAALFSLWFKRGNIRWMHADREDSQGALSGHG
jgi:hypothetical protein